MRIAISLTFLFAATATAQAVLPPFDTDYQVTFVGDFPNATAYGGIAFAPNNPNTLLLSAYGSQVINSYPLTRDANGKITAIGSGTLVANVAGNDGGLVFGPGNTLFYTSYPLNQVGQILPGGNAPALVTDLGPLGVASSVGACAFVPAGQPGAGQFKVCNYGGSWYDVPMSPNGNGTFALGTASPGILLSNNVEGILYPPTTSAQLNNHVLVAEYLTDVVVAYQLDNNGDPIVATRQVVIGSLNSASGGAIDPITGDFLFNSASSQLWRLEASTACGTFTNYGAASPGVGAVPTITGSGCPRIGQTVTITATGDPFGFGLLVFGNYQVGININGMTLLAPLSVTLTHSLDATGQWQLPLAIPATSYLAYEDFFMQVGYLDPSTPSGLKASDGLEMFVR